MITSVLFLFAFGIAQVAAGESCPYYDYPYTYYTWCDDGCCSTTYSPCCDLSIYIGAPFIAGITCGCVALILAVIGALVYRRRRYATTVQYGGAAAPTPQVFTTSTTTGYGGGYGHPGYATSNVQYVR